MSEFVPVIDLTPWRDGDGADRVRVATAVDRACREVGFFTIIGHGVVHQVVDAMRTMTDRFFDLPLDDKLAARPPHLKVNRGYAPKGSESLAYSVGVEAPTDLFEAFNIGPDSPDLSDPMVVAALDGYFAPNVWPTSVPELRPALVDYFSAVTAVSIELLDVFAVALGMPEHFFRAFTTHSTRTMRAIHYEQRPDEPAPLPGQIRMGGHTDYGILTVLYADPVPGLQIVGPDGDWHDVVPDEGTFIVNVGDLLALWTNDSWLSTVHRVVPPAGDTGPARRRSVAFFENGDYDAIVECLPTCVTDERPARYAPIAAGDHLMSKVWAPKTFEVADAVDVVGDRISAVIDA